MAKRKAFEARVERILKGISKARRKQARKLVEKFGPAYGLLIAQFLAEADAMRGHKFRTVHAALAKKVRVHPGQRALNELYKRLLRNSCEADDGNEAYYAAVPQTSNSSATAVDQEDSR